MRSFKDILFVVTPQKSSEIAFQRALKLAGHNQADLTIIKVVDEIVSAIKFPIRKEKFPLKFFSKS